MNKNDIPNILDESIKTVDNCIKNIKKETSKLERVMDIIQDICDTVDEIDETLEDFDSYINSLKYSFSMIDVCDKKAQELKKLNSMLPEAPSILKKNSTDFDDIKNNMDVL